MFTVTAAQRPEPTDAVRRGHCGPLNVHHITAMKGMTGLCLRLNAVIQACHAPPARLPAERPTKENIT